MTTLTLESATVESVRVKIKTSADPTATPPTFGVTTGARDDPPGSMSNGTWSGSWSSADQLIWAVSPTIGLSGSGSTLVVTEDTIHDLWVSWTIGTESPVKLAGQLRIL